MSRPRRFRSAITGRFVRKSTARRHPRTTIAEVDARALDAVIVLAELADVLEEITRAPALGAGLVSYGPLNAKVHRRAHAALRRADFYREGGRDAR